MTASIRQMGVITAHLIRKVAFNPAVVWLIAMPLVIIYILGITMHGLFSRSLRRSNPIASWSPSPRKPAFLSSGSPELPSILLLRRQGTHKRPARPFSSDRPTPHLSWRTAMSRSRLSLRREASSWRCWPEWCKRVWSRKPSKWQRHNRRWKMGVVRKVTQALEAPGQRTARFRPCRGRVSAPLKYFSIGLIVMFMAFASHSVMVHCVQDRSTGAYFASGRLELTPCPSTLGLGSRAACSLAPAFPSLWR